MGLVQVVDVGTTNVKSGIVNKEGDLLARETGKLEINRPEPGAAEHDPDELFKLFRDVIVKTNEGFGSRIDSLVLTGYLFGFLPLDENKEPLTGVITLLDERPKTIMSKVEGQYPLKELYRRTGCPPLFIYSFARILWLKEKKPDIYRRTRYFGDLKSLLIYRLTDEFATEPSTASATQIYNIHKGEWDEKILDWINLEKESFPAILTESEKLLFRDNIGNSLGLAEGARLLPGVYDGGAMIFGMGGYEGDEVICNLGTTAMLRKSSPEPVLDKLTERRLQTYKLSSKNWVIGGSLNNAGITLRWLKNNFAPNLSYDKLVKAATEVEPGSDNLVFLPFLTGERDPRMSNLSSGVFFGLKEYHSISHLTRAVMEGVVFALALILKAMEERNIDTNMIAIGGSGSKGTLWPQIVADVLEIPVRKSLTPDATLIGGAMLAYQKDGTYPSVQEASHSMVQKGKSFYPRERYLDRYRKLRNFFEKLVESAKPLFEEHAKLVNRSID